MARLNQIIAIANTKKTKVATALSAVHAVLSRPDLFSGLDRKYQSLDDEGEKLPPESKIIQKTASEVIATAKSELTELLDVIATQEFANGDAKADIVVDGVVIAKQVPVSYMLFLEKQVDVIKGVVQKLPVLTQDVKWNRSVSDSNIFVTDPVTTNRTKKVPRSFTKSPATEHHPAQVEMFTEDVIVGTWSKIDTSSAIPVSERDAMLKKIESLREAVKMAREEANSITVTDQKIGKSVLDFVFGSK
jgi:hypothetical protein